MLTPAASAGIVWRNAQIPRWSASEPATYDSARLSRLASSGVGVPARARDRRDQERRLAGARADPRRSRGIGTSIAPAVVAAGPRPARGGELGQRRRLAVDDQLAVDAGAVVEHEVVARRRDQRERRRRRVLDRELDAGRRADPVVRARPLAAHAATRPSVTPTRPSARPPNASQSTPGAEAVRAERVRRACARRGSTRSSLALLSAAVRTDAGERDRRRDQADDAGRRRWPRSLGVTLPLRGSMQCFTPITESPSIAATSTAPAPPSSSAVSAIARCERHRVRHRLDRQRGRLCDRPGSRRCPRAATGGRAAACGWRRRRRGRR